jgi:hypothetical protein
MVKEFFLTVDLCRADGTTVGYVSGQDYVDYDSHLTDFLTGRKHMKGRDLGPGTKPSVYTQFVTMVRANFPELGDAADAELLKFFDGDAHVNMGKEFKLSPKLKLRKMGIKTGWDDFSHVVVKLTRNGRHPAFEGVSGGAGPATGRGRFARFFAGPERPAYGGHGGHAGHAGHAGHGGHAGHDRYADGTNAFRPAFGGVKGNPWIAAMSDEAKLAHGF